MLTRGFSIGFRTAMRGALLAFLLFFAACSAIGDPLVGTFSIKMVKVGYGASPGETGRVRVTRQDDKYRFAIWDDRSGKWEETALRLKRCTFSEFAGQKSPELDAVVGGCQDHTAIFYSPEPMPKEMADVTHTGYAFFLAIGKAGTIWEGTME